MTAEAFTIDPEFAALCPPLTTEEQEALATSLQTEGCRDALVTWHEGSLLLDGHNRYALCQEHRLAYRVRAVSLPDRDAAMEWIVTNQLGRRNLTPEQKSYLRGKRYNLEKQRQGRPEESSQSEKISGETHKRLAAEYHVSPTTITRDGEFAEAVDTLEEQVRTEIRDLALKKNSPTQQRATKKQVTTAGQAIKKRQVDPLPFMQRGQWATYQVLEGITLLTKFDKDEHGALNSFLDQPHITANDGLDMLRNLATFTLQQRQQLYDKHQSPDPRDRDFVMHIAAKKVPSPDPQSGIVNKILGSLGDITKTHSLWRRQFPDEPWMPTLAAVETELLAVLEARYTDIKAQIKTLHDERITTYAQAFQSH